MIDIAELNRQVDMIKERLKVLENNKHDCACKSVISQETIELNKRLIANFKKVSKQIFNDDSHYDNIKIPKRATTGSAGYDFITPVDINLKPGESTVIRTGIRCEMDPDFVLMIFPRSGQGFKFKIQLANTVGVIDSDYYNSANEGHIMIKLVNDNNENKTFSVRAGSPIAQGVFLQYYKTEEDNADGIRDGGFGSTDEVSQETVNESSNLEEVGFIDGLTEE